MREDGLGFICFYPLGHHVEDVVHDGGTKFEVKVRFHPLLRDGLGDALGMPALELASK